MHPVLFSIGSFEIPTYGVCIATGLVLCLAVFYHLVKKREMPEMVFDNYLTAALVGIILGFAGAMLFQSFYNFLESGEFRLGGMTFMGGLIGGVIGFLVYMWLFVKDKKLRAAFWDVADIAFAGITIAHCLGRIGCFFAGCCYGIEAGDSLLGVEFPNVSGARYPTQLFEAVFLFAMFLVAYVYNLNKKKRGYGVGIYAITYGVWRFFLEYLRGDNRGGIVGAALSPSQVQSILFVVVGTAYLVAVFLLYKKGLIAPTLDWTEELKLEAEIRETRQKEKEAKKSGVSYEEYNASIEDAEKETEAAEKTEDIEKERT